MNQVIINGKKYTGGNSIVVSNNKVIIDGVDQSPSKCKKIDIKIVGNVENLEVDTCNTINVHGDVNSLQTTSGDVDVSGNVTDSVDSTSGDIECGDVGGSVKSVSGDIKCKNINGSVKTVSGDIRNK